MLTTAQIRTKYGEPGTANFVTITLPFPVRIAWDLIKTTTKMQCHKLVADKFLAVFNDLLKAYGLAEIQRLGIDLYGVCYNFR